MKKPELVNLPDVFDPMDLVYEADLKELKRVLTEGLGIVHRNFHCEEEGRLENCFECKEEILPWKEKARAILKKLEQ